MKKIVTIISILLLFPILVFGQTQSAQDFTYSFNLYFDNGKLVADRDAEFSYDILPEEFPGSSGAFKLEIIDLLDRSTTVNFEPQQGKMKVLAPYKADGKEAKFYDASGTLLLTLAVNESSFCDDDGVCEENYGENYLNCSHDCQNTQLTGTPVPGDDRRRAARADG